MQDRAFVGRLRKESFEWELVATGLKPGLIANGLRGAEAPSSTLRPTVGSFTTNSKAGIDFGAVTVRLEAAPFQAKL